MLCILTALGSYGDVFPMIALGAAMRRRGHEVKIVANPHFAGVIRQAGLECVGVMATDDYEQLTRHADLWHPWRGMAVVFRYGAIGCLEELLGVLDSLHRPRETVIGAHGLDVASRLLAEKQSARVVSLCFAPYVLWSNHSPPRLPIGPSAAWSPQWMNRFAFWLGHVLVMHPHVVRPLNEHRRQIGLPPLRERFWDWYYRVAPPVCLFPDWYAPAQPDWPAGTVTTGFPLWDGGDAAELTDEARTFLDQGAPPIVFTPGSAHRAAHAFFEAAVDACRRLGRRGVLLTKYPEQIPASLPDTVRWLGFQPLGKVLARSVAFVHHGGIGSCSQALAAGVPQVVQPMAFDQFDNAMRLRRLGVGAEVSRKYIHGGALAAMLDALLASEKTVTATDRCAGLLAERDGIELACDALENRLADSD